MAIQARIENTKMATTRRDRGALVMKGAITTDLIFNHHDRDVRLSFAEHDLRQSSERVFVGREKDNASNGRRVLFDNLRRPVNHDA